MSKTPIAPSLSALIEKFSQNDVIAEMEKEYQTAPARLVRLSLLDDNSYIGRVPLAPSIVEYFASTIKEKGIFNPLVLRPHGNRFEVVLGRKRYLGAKKAGTVSVPAVIREMGDEEELLMLLADNRDQKESNIVEMALVYQALRKRFGYTQETLASLSHQSRVQITNTERLLRLPVSLQEEVSLGELSYGHAKAIASLSQEEALQMAKEIEERSLSVRETEALVREKKKGSSLSQEEELRAKTKAKAVESKKKSVTFLFEDEPSKQEFLYKLLRE